MDPAVHRVQNLPALIPQLLLHAYRERPAALLQGVRFRVLKVPGVVPLLQVIQELERQMVTPGTNSGRGTTNGRVPGPSARWGWRQELLPAQNPLQTAEADIRGDDCAARLSHRRSVSHTTVGLQPTVKKPPP